jgi:phosphoribosyl 1,2-cyclic phosphodiesterase
MMDHQGEFIVRFWGVRGSYPVAGGATVRYGGNTSCVEIEAGGRAIILDAGTGIVSLGRALARKARERGAKVEAVLLFSHLHHDHTQGFPFFVPAFIPGASISIYGPDFLGSTPKTTLEQVMQPPYFPIRLADMRAGISFDVLRETDRLSIGAPGEGIRIHSLNATVDDEAVHVRVLHSYAHPGGVYHYRVDWQGCSVVYATDTEGYVNGDRRLAAFARGADVLIHDAQYTDEHYLGMAPGLSVTQGFGHSTVSMACQTAMTCEARQLVLFHHAPEYEDAQLDQIGQRAREIFANTLVAREGLEIRLPVETSNRELVDSATFVNRS